MKTLAELAAIRDKMKHNATVREESNDAPAKIVVGMATCGIAAGARTVLNAATQELAKRNIEHVTLAQTGCIGMCRFEPIVDVFMPGKEKITYVLMNPEKMARVISEHIINGRPVQEYTIGANENK